MDLNADTIHEVIHPTAIFSVWPANDTQSVEHSEVESIKPSWAESQLNPKNRIDSLAPLKSPLWSIDGCTGLGTQFYVVPLFIDSPPPMRFDVFIAEQAVASPMLRKLLDLEMVFHAKDRSRVRRQAIAFYILRALQAWTSEKYGLDKVRDMYRTMPFGTRIIFKNLALDVRQTTIELGRMHSLENFQLTVKNLGAMWNMDLGEFPSTIDISQLVFVQQLHDSVCVVRHRHGQKTTSQDDPEELWILKSLTSSTNYMYHEIRILLSMEPHPNVIPRPVKLVTKPCKWAAKKVGVVGFLETYHSGGSMRDTLPLLRMNNKLHVGDQIRWATQITSGLRHVRDRGKTYYPDLRLDNIVLSSTGDAILVDFEQRGVWVEFASPEVNALEYMRVLALGQADQDDYENLENNDKYVVLEHPSISYADLLDRYLPGWQDLQGRQEYTNPPHGYNIPWLCLSPREQEAAEVYMLGRVLWCIFEGMSAPQRGAVWQSYRYEPDFEFPEFRHTPVEMAGLIDRCTRGRRDQLSVHIIRKGSQLVLRDDSGVRNNSSGNGTEAEIRRIAKEWWQNEIAWAVDFLQMREDLMKTGEWKDNYYDRPSLREVEASLEAFRAKLLFS